MAKLNSDQYNEAEEHLLNKYADLIAKLDRTDANYIANRIELEVHRDILINRLWDDTRSDADKTEYSVAAARYSQIAAANTRALLKLQVELHQEIARWKTRVPIALGILFAAIWLFSLRK